MYITIYTNLKATLQADFRVNMTCSPQPMSYSLPVKNLSEFFCEHTNMDKQTHICEVTFG